jgi:hypothetical protein
MCTKKVKGPNFKTFGYMMISQGYSNDDIAEALSKTPQQIRGLRSRYNKSGLEIKYSVRTKPKKGTKNRDIYDYIILNPNATMTQVASATKTDRGNVSIVKRRYITKE